MPYADDYTTTNAPDIERPFTNTGGETVSEATSDLTELVTAALTAANAMHSAAWHLIDSRKLDCARDILALPSDIVGEWVYAAAGYGCNTLLEDFGINVWTMERDHPAIMRTRKLFSEL